MTTHFKYDLMKNFICFSIVLLSNLLFSQSISFSKLVSYAKYQDLKIIKSDLDNKGFIVNNDSSRLGAVKTENAKTASEIISAQFVYKNNEFVAAYQSPIYFKTLERQFLEIQSKYLRTSQGISFYDCGTYIVGIKESEYIIGVYTIIK